MKTKTYFIAIVSIILLTSCNNEKVALLKNENYELVKKIVVLELQLEVSQLQVAELRVRNLEYQIEISRMKEENNK